ncbi:hypothetical protein NEOLEDRAFT_224044 [Neolentinus lepideus HHB14362 ss-1]|uniref:Uncharacterized protein n=1 Tax=Neolentinus lepideus HHB14362 ss-1 TaxID=1314782 RepID=A0A165TCT4_9AGAM|nr:hypothetical protein NEOLEDRAFT_224044 [Neolentinus lepideus HHB14362 ss-1]
MPRSRVRDQLSEKRRKHRESQVIKINRYRRTLQSSFKYQGIAKNFEDDDSSSPMNRSPDRKWRQILEFYDHKPKASHRHLASHTEESSKFKKTYCAGAATSRRTSTKDNHRYGGENPRSGFRLARLLGNRISRALCCPFVRQLHLAVLILRSEALSCLPPGSCKILCDGAPSANFCVFLVIFGLSRSAGPVLKLTVRLRLLLSASATYGPCPPSAVLHSPLVYPS